jgi:hypothetical protein
LCAFLAYHLSGCSMQENHTSTMTLMHVLQ